MEIANRTMGNVYLRNRASSQSQPIREKFEYAFYNTGNYFFEDAVERHLTETTTVYDWEDVHSASTLVLSMANFLSPHNDLGQEAILIEKSKIQKIVMIGAGAQCESFENTVTLSPGTERFIRVISERSKSIGVRGQFTADILESYGIRNIEVIGCPSLFYHMTRNIAIDFNPGDRTSIAIHSTPHGGFRDRISELWAFGIINNATYILQSEKSLLMCISGEGTEEDKSNLDFISHYYRRPDMEMSKVRQWLLNGKIFFDCESWIDAMKEYAFAVGSRFHGNVAATLAGRPSLTLVFDSRTRELCEHFDLPYMMLSKLINLDKNLIQDKWERSSFSKIFPARYDQYRSFLETNGLTHKLMAGSEAPDYSDNSDSMVNNNHPSFRSIGSFIAANKAVGNSQISVDAILTRMQLDRTICERNMIDGIVDSSLI